MMDSLSSTTLEDIIIRGGIHYWKLEYSEDFYTKEE